MNTHREKRYHSHGTGAVELGALKSLGRGVVIEDGVRIFHPENVYLGDNVYIGHDSILSGYFKNELRVGDHTWIGSGCFLHAAGGIYIGHAVGIAPMVKILTSAHCDNDQDLPVLFHPLEFAEVRVEDGADIGIGSILLPGVTIGQGAIVGAGSVVTHDVPQFAVAAGTPAKVIRMRGEAK